MFLSKLLPSKGVYCVALLTPSGGFRHFFYSNISAAQNKIEELDVAGHNCYIAQAAFDADKVNKAREYNRSLPKDLSAAERKKLRKKERGQENAISLKNFFLDIDCGEKWPIKTQKEGVDALKLFVHETGLPFPAVVSSGNGLYAHWILKEEIPSSQWQTIAFILKKVVSQYSPAIGGDSSRTADSASVLRVPGTVNRKPGKPPKRVVLLKDAEPIEFMQFVRILTAAAKKKGIDVSKTKAPKPSKDINSEFFSGLEQKSIPSSASKIAESCMQMSMFRDAGGDVSEPLWYSCLGVLKYCQDGEEISHEWSKGHPDYDPDETNAKLAQWENANVGPSTCVNIGSTNPSGCLGCKHNGKIKSPIVLGRPDPKAKEPTNGECEAPEKFRRSKDGLYAEQDGRWIKFYDQDLYPEKLAWDESLNYEVMTITHYLPFEGKMSFTIRSAIVNDPKLLINALADNHVKVVGNMEKKYMAAYLESYSAKLQRNRRMALLLCQMGWKKTRNGKPIFVLGKKIFHTDGTVEDASLAKNVPKSAEGYRTSGSLRAWTIATEVLDQPGMEPFAFALLAGGFGAPLMKFTGFDGAMVSLVGGTGAGKTLILRWIQSVWGYHNDLMMLKDDTKNALVSRLGVYGNLPLTVDEVTNISNMELSDLVYRVTQGRDKARLTKSSEERKLLNKWNTLAVTSSNSYLVDKLSQAKHDASAEINRVFEYQVTENMEFRGPRTTKIYWLLDQNYGHAGEVYAKWLVQHIPEVQASLEKIKSIIDEKARMRGEERFWGAILSATIYGGLVAKKLGLVKIDIGRVLNWAINTVQDMRGNKKDILGDAVDTLGQFLDDHANCRLVLKGSGAHKMDPFRLVEEPRGPLLLRYELDNERLYIASAAFKSWLGKRFGNFNQFKKELLANEVLVMVSKRKVLGAGTTYSGAQQSCLEIDLANPRLGRTMEELNEKASIVENK